MFGPLARRPGYGSAGQPIKVRANHFLVECKLVTAYQYDVDIDYIRRPPKDAPPGAPVPKLKADKPPGPELKRFLTPRPSPFLIPTQMQEIFTHVSFKIAFFAQIQHIDQQRNSMSSLAQR